MTWKIRGYDLTKAQRGWVCDCCFTVETAEQFTPEEHTVRHGRTGRGVVSMLLAMFGAYLLARRTAANLAAPRGVRVAKGWA